MLGASVSFICPLGSCFLFGFSRNGGVPEGLGHVTPPGCLSAGKSFREQQCEEFNGVHLNTNRLGNAIAWVPKYSGIAHRDRCKLICRANGTGYFYVLAPKVRMPSGRRRCGRK